MGLFRGSVRGKRRVQRVLQQVEKFLPHLAITVITINLILLVVLAVVNRQPVMPPVESSSTLTCTQVVQMARWGAEKYGGPRQIEVDSAEFGKRVGTVIVEKADPLRVMITESEANRFVRRFSAAWDSVRNTGNCALVGEWLRGDYQTYLARFWAALSSSSFGTYADGKGSDLATTIENLPRFKKFARSEKELNNRLIDVSSRIVEESSSLLRTTYRSDYRALVTDTFEQIMTGADLLSESTLFAKSVLGAMDQYSTYLSAPEFEEFYQELAAGASGIGIKVRKVPTGLYLEQIVKESPAGRSGKLQEGDVITQVDDFAVKGLPSIAAKRLLKGNAGTFVSLQILKQDGAKLTTKLKRQAFSMDESRISYRWRKGTKRNARIAVIEVPSFYGRGGMDNALSESSSSEDLEKALRALMASREKPTSIVLDMRGNPGGYLEEAISMAGMFMGNQPVVGVVEKETRRVLRGTRETIYAGPLVVLLDEDSASAAEVLAGALKDHQRALVVGRSSSYGKGSVQRLYPLEEEFSIFQKSFGLWTGVAKLTTSVFYSPLGHSPANGGITPNVQLVAENKMAIDKDNSIGDIPESDPFLSTSEAEKLKEASKSLQAQYSILEKEVTSPLRQELLSPLTVDSANSPDSDLSQALWLAERYSAFRDRIAQK